VGPLQEFVAGFAPVRVHEYSLIARLRARDSR